MPSPMYLLLLLVASICLGTVSGQAFTIHNEEDSNPYPDCHSLYKAGYINNGTYRLSLGGKECLVPCEFRDGFGFTIFLNRVDAKVNWVRPYSDYEQGFGYPLHDYFAGLYAINLLTHKGNVVLDSRFLDWDGSEHYSVNSHFTVGDKYSGYLLTVSGDYQGTVVNDMIYNNGQRFYTYDHPDPHGCVSQQRSGWWYYYCTKTLPTGHYYPQGHYATNKTLGDGIYWADYKGPLWSLKSFVMSVRPNV